MSQYNFGSVEIDSSKREAKIVVKGMKDDEYFETKFNLDSDL